MFRIALAIFSLLIGFQSEARHATRLPGKPQQPDLQAIYNQRADAEHTQYCAERVQKKYALVQQFANEKGSSWDGRKRKEYSPNAFLDREKMRTLDDCSYRTDLYIQMADNRVCNVHVFIDVWYNPNNPNNIYSGPRDSATGTCK